MKVNLAIGQLVWVKSERDVIFIGSMVLIIAGTYIGSRARILTAQKSISTN